MNAARLIQRTGIVLSTGLGLLILLFVVTTGAAGTGQPTGAADTGQRTGATGTEQPAGAFAFTHTYTGCYGAVTAGTGMWDGVGQMTIQVPGPIVTAYLWWAGGFIDGGAQMVVTNTIAGQPPVTKNITGEILARSNEVRWGPLWWNLWRANLNPQGHPLVSPGLNVLDIGGWEETGNGLERNGATLVVVYRSGETPCLHPVALHLDDDDGYLNYFYQSLSERRVFDIEPAPYARTITTTFSYAGTDPEKDPPCRHGKLYYASGTGGHPTSDLSHMIAENIDSETRECSILHFAPATGHDGGYIDREWSVFTAHIRVPAGNEWVAFQMDSPPGCSLGSTKPATAKASNEFQVDSSYGYSPSACGESGAWVQTLLKVPLRAPGLAISKTDGVINVAPGDTLNYTIHYRNQGNQTAENVTIVDTLPMRSSYVSCTPAGSCAHSNGKVTFYLGPVDPGEGGTVHVVIKLNETFPAGSTPITNHAVINTTTPRDDPFDNASDDTDTVVATVALNIDKSGPVVVAPGDRMTYVIRSWATGNAWAEHTTITDRVPQHTAFSECQPMATCQHDPTNHIVTWNLGRVTPNQPVNVTLSVQVTSPLTNGLPITNIAGIVADAAAPKTSRFTSTVRSDHRLKIDKTSLQNPVFAGDLLNYRIPWDVTGNEQAPGVVITDVIPDGTTFRGVSPQPECTYSQTVNMVTCDLDDLDPPIAGTVFLTVSVNNPPALHITNTAVMCDHDNPTQCDDGRIGHHLSPIGGLVWLDENGDGVPAAGERGIPSVPITLTDAGPAQDCTGPLLELDDKYTDAAGVYRFEPLQSARFAYCLDVDVTAALTLTQCLTPTKIPTMPIVLDPGEQSLRNNFGYRYNLATIAGTVFEDLDQNGAQAGNEGDLEGVRVRLLDPGADHQCGTGDDRRLKRTRTNSVGWYEFTDLPFGDYCISIPIRQPELQGRKLTTPDSPTVPVRVEDCGQFIEQDFGYSGVYTVRVTPPPEPPFVGTSALCVYNR